MPTRGSSGFRADVPRIQTSIALLTALIFASILAGCASWCPKKSVHAKTPPRNGVNAPDCACTLDYRMNLCVTVNGADSVPADLSFQRQHEDGWRDSIDHVSTHINPSGPQCFGEARGVQRIFMRKRGAVVDSTGWFEIPTVDCCHGAAKTVDFKR
jgi:hypothetical protein